MLKVLFSIGWTYFSVRYCLKEDHCDTAALGKNRTKWDILRGSDCISVNLQDLIKKCFQIRETQNFTVTNNLIYVTVLKYSSVYLILVLIIYMHNIA